MVNGLALDKHERSQVHVYECSCRWFSSMFVAVFDQTMVYLGQSYAWVTYICQFPVLTTTTLTFQHLSCIHRNTETRLSLHLLDLEVEVLGPLLAHRMENHYGMDHCQLVPSTSDDMHCCICYCGCNYSARWTNKTVMVMLLVVNLLTHNLYVIWYCWPSPWVSQIKGFCFIINVS